MAEQVRYGDETSGPENTASLVTGVYEVKGVLGGDCSSGYGNDSPSTLLDIATPENHNYGISKRVSTEVQRLSFECSTSEVCCSYTLWNIQNLGAVPP